VHSTSRQVKTVVLFPLAGSFGKHQYFGTLAKYLPIIVIVFSPQRGIQQVPKRWGSVGRMDGAVTVLPPRAFMVWTGAALILYLIEFIRNPPK
jgi:hypothetical protein